MSAHPTVMSYYMRLEESKLERLFPEFQILSQRFPKEIALQICLCRAVPCSSEGIFETTVVTRCEVCKGMRPHLYPWSCRCVVRSRSRYPMYPMKNMFVEFPVPMAGETVGIGFTSNQDITLSEGAGIRIRSQNSRQFFLDARNPYPAVSVKDDSCAGVCSSWTGVGNKIFQFDDVYLFADNIGVAVDYNRQQLVIRTKTGDSRPASHEISRFLRLDLPPHLRNKLLFPVVQAPKGCKLNLRFDDHCAGKITDMPSLDIERDYTATHNGATNSETRQRRCRCPRHGIKTHRRRLFWRVPITNVNVYRGQCLQCMNGE